MPRVRRWSPGCWTERGPSTKRCRCWTGRSDCGLCWRMKAVRFCRRHSGRTIRPGNCASKDGGGRWKSGRRSIGRCWPICVSRPRIRPNPEPLRWTLKSALRNSQTPSQLRHPGANGSKRAWNRPCLRRQCQRRRLNWWRWKRAKPPPRFQRFPMNRLRRLFQLLRLFRLVRLRKSRKGVPTPTRERMARWHWMKEIQRLWMSPHHQPKTMQSPARSPRWWRREVCPRRRNASEWWSRNRRPWQKSGMRRPGCSSSRSPNFWIRPAWWRRGPFQNKWRRCRSGFRTRSSWPRKSETGPHWTTSAR